MAGRLEVQVPLGRPAAQPRPRREPTPMRLLVMGDFSARPPDERPPLASRPTWRVDPDNVEDVMRRLAPRLALPSVGELRFEQLDDFQPDSLYERLDLFQTLRDARSRPPPAGESPLDALLGKAPDARPAGAAPATGIDALLRQVVAPHVVPDTSAQDQAYRAAVDAAISDEMRALLHHPSFQALEAAWRGLQWLISSLELDERLQLHLFDVRRDELLADVVAAQGRLAETGLHRALADRWRNVPGGESWTAVGLLARFGPSDADVGLLAALGLVASQAGGPLLAEADPVLAAADAGALAGWRALRASEAAPWIGLAAPRVLLRRPYGRGSDPVDAFAFEEFAGAPDHENFLWGNPALAVLLLIGRAFSARGWDFEPGDERDLGDLPAWTFEQDGELVLQPCAERLLGEREVGALLAAGLMPLASHRDRNEATLLRMQSIADPPEPLAGLPR